MSTDKIQHSDNCRCRAQSLDDGRWWRCPKCDKHPTHPSLCTSEHVLAASTAATSNNAIRCWHSFSLVFVIAAVPWTKPSDRNGYVCDEPLRHWHTAWCSEWVFYYYLILTSKFRARNRLGVSLSVYYWRAVLLLSVLAKHVIDHLMTIALEDWCLMLMRWLSIGAGLQVELSAAALSAPRKPFHWPSVAQAKGQMMLKRCQPRLTTTMNCQQLKCTHSEDRMRWTIPNRLFCIAWTVKCHLRR